MHKIVNFTTTTAMPIGRRAYGIATPLAGRKVLIAKNSVLL